MTKSDSHLLVILCVVIVPMVGFTQADFQLGFGLSAKFDIGIGKNKRLNNTNFILSSAFGIGKKISTDQISGIKEMGVFLSLKFGVNLYRGGVGNSKMPTFFDNHQIDLYNTFSITPGFFSNDEAVRTFDYYRPLYTWNTNFASALENPFPISITYATSFIWNLPVLGKHNDIQLDSFEHFRRSQRLGFVGISLGRYAAAGYYNDGPPFSRNLGDGYDRYWTGGGFIQIGASYPTQLKPNETGYSMQLNDFQLIWSFDKFTGYNVDAYEVANKLKLNRVPYKNPETASFNRGIMRFNLIYSDIGFTFSNIDIRAGRDIQDLIHRASNFPYHPNVYKNGFLLGIQYLFNNKI